MIRSILVTAATAIALAAAATPAQADPSPYRLCVDADDKVACV